MEKVVVITGGGGFLGNALSHELLKRGWVVASFSRSSAEYPCDVTNADSVLKAMEKAAQKGAVRAIIHAASPAIERVPAADASPENALLHMRVAVEGAKNLVSSAEKYMPEGVFVGITSDAAASMGGYVEAKRTMEEYLDGIRAPFAVRVVSVGFLPGGLNADLPEQVKMFLASKSESLDSVARRIADACESSE